MPVESGERSALTALLYQMADDELVIGHRDSEWLGLAPHLEEDIAFASIAQDEVGHAVALYRLLEELGEGKADDLAYGRPPERMQNAVLLERPNGSGTYLQAPAFDWGYTVARRLVYDLFDAVRLAVAAESSYRPLAELAVRIRREERYHLLHHATWFRRLAGGTAESRRRLEEGVAKVWPEVAGLFALGAWAAQGPLFPAGSSELLRRWEAELRPLFQETGMAWQAVNLDQVPAAEDGRSGHHSPDLAALLATMGEVRRGEPEAVW